jgi:competence protein ComEC
MVFAINKRYIPSVVCLAVSTGVILFSPSLCKGPMVTFLDTGQAESAIVETGKTTLVVDTARTGLEASAYLRYRGIDRIDALVLSHSAADHAGGLGKLLKDFKVDSLMVSYLEEPIGIPEDTEVIRLEGGDNLQIGRLDLLVLHPHKGFVPSDENNASLVVRLDTGDFSVLFTGDIEAEAEEALVAYSRWLNADVLKVAHHGSKTSSTEPFLKAIRPSVSVISAGRDNPYGHPHREVLEKLRTTEVFRTDRDGSIRFCSENNTLRVYRWKDFVLHPAIANPEEEVLNLWRLLLHW